ncbi:RidA family protein [Streptomyces sp. 71268]|uniref:RidA family protein n=1 Tax=Streptomyces sp. 71268 TaxID=3002640 RepID=UPI0023F981FA|nr:RidA family protein [Streptomyces sp. 71268]WEV24880.1 RidA family protein [Streptomyces sp. 71268]
MTPSPPTHQPQPPEPEPDPHRASPPDQPTAPPLRRVNPAELAPPSGFSHAVTATGGQLVLLAGQTALDGAGHLVDGPLPDQFERALSNLLTALRAAGGRPEHLARVTVYATDVADYRAHAPELGRVWRRLAGRDYPAMAVVGVVRLWDERARVELDGIALLP